MTETNEIKNKRSGASSHVRFNAVEFARIKKMQLTTGLSIPDLLKKALLTRFDLEQPLLSKEDVDKILSELRAQGTNLNQIAKNINSGLMQGWSQSFNSFVRISNDIRHIISVNRANR